jgi:nucleotide-binding universal stress UspA family protein
MAGQPRRIVVGYDGSGTARRALDAAAQLTGYGSTLTVVTVATEASVGDTMLAEARDRLIGRHVQARDVQSVGDPAEEGVVAARHVEADLVVLSRRNGGLDAAWRRAPCDVLVVSEPS